MRIHKTKKYIMIRKPTRNYKTRHNVTLRDGMCQQRQSSSSEAAPLTAETVQSLGSSRLVSFDKNPPPRRPSQSRLLCPLWLAGMAKTIAFTNAETGCELVESLSSTDAHQKDGGSLPQGGRAALAAGKAAVPGDYVPSKGAGGGP